MVNKLRNVSIMLDIGMPLAVLVIFFPPCFIWYAGSLMSLIYLIQKAIFLLCAMYFVKYCLYKNKFLVSLLTYIIWIILITYRQGNSIESFGTYLNIFSVCVITVYCMERNPLKFTGFVSFVLSVLLLFNTLLWKEGGMYVNANGQASFVLGTKTSITEYQIVACCFIWLYYSLLPIKKKIKAISLWIILLLSLILWNFRQPISTSIICLGLFAGLIILQHFRIKAVDAVLKYGFGAILVLNIGIVFFNAQMLFSNFITGVMHENADLNYRTSIWQVVLTKIADSPWIGHGVNSGTFFSIGVGTSSINQATHNCLLYFVFTAGVLGTVYLFLICFFMLRKSGIETALGRIFHISIICFGMLWITEQIKGYELFFMCLLAGACIAPNTEQISEKTYIFQKEF